MADASGPDTTDNITDNTLILPDIRFGVESGLTAHPFFFLQLCNAAVGFVFFYWCTYLQLLPRVCTSNSSLSMLVHVRVSVYLRVLTLRLDHALSRAMLT